MSEQPGEPRGTNPAGEPPGEGPVPAEPPAAPAPAAPVFPPDPAPPPRPRARRPDPWAHRRGEPRIFAFLWTVFLFSATAATFLAALSSGQATPDVMRPATRALFAIVAMGIVILWPMVRLSQTPDRHPLAGCTQDLVVMLVPAQAVIWPQWLGWLGRWSLDVVGSVSLLLGAWGLLAGGLLALAQAGRWRAIARGEPARGGWSGAGWMLFFMLLGLAGTLGALGPEAPGSVSPVRIGWMFSPITGVYELTRDRSWTGMSAAVRPGHWWAISITAAAGLPGWIAAGLRVRGIKGRSGLH